MTRLIKYYLVGVAAVLIAAVILSRDMPWWGAALLLAGILASIWYGTSWAVKRWWRAQIGHGFTEAAHPLTHALVTVNGVSETTCPPSFVPDEEEGEEDTNIHAWYCDITLMVTPSDQLLPYAESEDDDEDVQSWSPSNFRLVPFDAPMDKGVFDMWGLGEYQQGVAVHAEQLDVPAIDSGQSHTSDSIVGMSTDEYEGELSIEGAALVRIVFCVPRDMPDRMKLRYLTEDYGEVRLPKRSK